MSKQKAVSKTNLLKGIVLPMVDPRELATNVVSAIADAKSISEQVAIKFDTLNQRVADIIQSGIDFGSTADKVFEALSNGETMESVSFANVLWVEFATNGGYTKGNAKQMVSLVRTAVAHKVRIEPGFINLDKFQKALSDKGMPSLENPSKVVRVKAKATPKGKGKTSQNRAGRTSRHASYGLVTSMGQEGFGSMLRALVNDLDFDSLTDDGMQSAIWEFLVEHKWATKSADGKYKLV